MASKEICITEYKLADSKGNMEALCGNWSGVPAVSSDLLSESKGVSAGAVQDSLESTKQVSDSFQNLLDNTLAFLTEMGMTFKKSDEKAKENINSVTRC